MDPDLFKADSYKRINRNLFNEGQLLIDQLITNFKYHEYKNLNLSFIDKCIFLMKKNRYTLGYRLWNWRSYHSVE